MAASDLQLITGNTFAFTATWGTKDGDTFVPVDVSGCRARFVMRDVHSGVLLAESTTEDGGIVIDDPTNGVISVRLAPDKTRALDGKPLGQAAYELRVYFPSGDEYSVMMGLVVVTEGVIRD